MIKKRGEGIAEDRDGGIKKCNNEKQGEDEWSM